MTHVSVYHLPPGEPRSSGPDVLPKSLLAKPGQTGLRPPGFSALSGTRLAALGFVRSSSASSVSSNQSNDSGHADPSQASQRESVLLDQIDLIVSKLLEPWPVEYNPLVTIVTANGLLPFCSRFSRMRAESYGAAATFVPTPEPGDHSFSQPSFTKDRCSLKICLVFRKAFEENSLFFSTVLLLIKCSSADSKSLSG